MHKGEELALNFDERWQRDVRADEGENEVPSAPEPLSREEVRELLAKRHKKEGVK